MKFDGIILDVDGTIWNTTQIVAEAWNKAIKENFPEIQPVTAEILKGQFGKTIDVIGKNLFGVLGDSDRDKLLKMCCEAEQLAINENQKDIAYEGVISSIKELSKTIPLFIVSNCQSGYIELVMKKNGITEFITDFECFGDTGRPKDENISLIVKRNNLKKPVYVGDTQGDFEACKKAGVPFIWAAYGFGRPETQDYYGKLDRFADLKNLL